MNAAVIIAVVLIGVSAGLRTFTAPAVVAWAAYLGSIGLNSTPFAFMSSSIAVGVLTLAALGEYVFDLLPSAPARTRAPALIGRFLTASLSAACLLTAAGQSSLIGLLAGAAAIGAAFAGYEVRTGTSLSRRINDAFVAIPEDFVAIGLALTAVLVITHFK